MVTSLAMLTLHYHPLSSYSRKVRTGMLHRGDEHEVRVVDLLKGASRRPEFIAMSPFGKVPVLEVEDGSLFYESTSILEWLEERGPRVLLPEGEERTARHFDRLGDLYVMSPMSTYWWRQHTDEGRAAPDVIRKGWALFEKQLEGRDFVCKSGFSLGDLSCAIGTDYMEKLGTELPSGIRAYRDRCFAVPAVAQSLEEAKPFIEPALAMRN